VLVLDMIEILPPLRKYKYDTWRILPVKCYIDNSVRLRSCIQNININHVLLQIETVDTKTNTTPQLLMISTHAANGTSSVATFSVLVVLGGKRGIALIDSGSTDTFMDYAFATKANCAIQTTTTRKVRVARGGHLDTNAITAVTTYSIQSEVFRFRLLPLKGV
jgi:hypothetical protein